MQQLMSVIVPLNKKSIIEMSLLVLVPKMHLFDSGMQQLMSVIIVPFNKESIVMSLPVLVPQEAPF